MENENDGEILKARQRDHKALAENILRKKRENKRECQ